MRRAGTMLLLMMASSAGGLARADPTVDFRIGAQRTLGTKRPPGGDETLPAAGLYVSWHASSKWHVVVGYELVRFYDAQIGGGDDIDPPQGTGGLRGGVRRERTLGHGTFLRGGLLLGLSSPYLTLLSSAEAPDGGAVLDVSADLAFGVAGGGLALTAYLVPTWSVGQLSRGQGSADISGFSFGVGVGLGIMF